jgi:hypothetical protein
MDIQMEGKDIDLGLWEFGANDKQGLSRLLSSPKPDSFLICFSIDKPTSLDQIKSACAFKLEFRIHY